MGTSIPTDTLQKFTTFGDMLRFLRRRAGITQMELAIAVGYSDAQISRLEQNLRLPDIPTIEARFAQALYLDDEPKAVARLLELAANVRREDVPALGLCPYKGLNYFDESDAELFVGREALAEQLTEQVLKLATPKRTSGARFLAIVGASGSGKSSLVRAGLIPSLRWGKQTAGWQIISLTPSRAAAGKPGGRADAGKLGCRHCPPDRRSAKRASQPAPLRQTTHEGGRRSASAAGCRPIRRALYPLPFRGGTRLLH